jgi:L-alanine-DL-glutamate epimerase-like enolase superfamily enzyme
MSLAAPTVTVESIDLFERDVVLRMPFRFGAVTLHRAPQAWARARVRLADGRTGDGMAAELLAPKWFDKDPALGNEENVAQLRASLGIARTLYLDGVADTAFGHFIRHYPSQIERAAAQRLNALVALYGPALIDRAVLDAMCRALGEPFHEVASRNRIGLVATERCPDLADVDLGAFLARLRPADRIAARHTVGLVDPITREDQSARVNDGLPETLEEVVAAYGVRWFKLKVAGDVDADIARLARIAGVLDRIDGGYACTLDGNEQYDGIDGVLRLWRGMQAEPRLDRLCASIAFVEQPIGRQAALAEDVSALSDEVPVIIDESDDSLDAFVSAKARGYRGVSSKTCKGLYKSFINAARCETWNRETPGRFLMSAEDLTIQAGVSLQQDLALVSLLGIRHVERNAHHYVDGMAALDPLEQDRFLAGHPDLYERSFGAVRVRLREGELALGSLRGVGYASNAAPEWRTMRAMATP